MVIRLLRFAASGECLLLPPGILHFRTGETMTERQSTLLTFVYVGNILDTE